MCKANTVTSLILSPSPALTPPGPLGAAPTFPPTPMGQEKPEEAFHGGQRPPLQGTNSKREQTMKQSQR